MKIYGYEKDIVDDEKLIELEEVTIQASSENLKKIAQFILETVKIIDENHDKFGHEHFKDFMREYGWEGPDIIISK